MPYDPKAISNEFLLIARREDCVLTPMKIQKLVYYAHGWHLAIKGTPLINEQVEAWPFGPVIPSLYYAYRQYGRDPVTELTETIRVLSDPDDPWKYGYEKLIPSLKDDLQAEGFTKALLDRIWSEYGKFDAIQLSNMTHEVGAPWHQIASKYDLNPPRGTDIPKEVIRDYFVSAAAKG